MSNCLSCDATIPVDEVEVGDIIVCDECGTEHEVLSLDPVELMLLEDDEEDDVAGVAGKDDDDDDDDEDDDEDDGYDDDFSAASA